MSLSPRFEIRQAQYYAAIRLKTQRKTLAVEAPKMIAEVAKWLGKNRVAPGGPPLIRYVSIGNDETVDVDSGHVVISPAGEAHGFVNSGDGELRLTAIHGAPRFTTEWLEGVDPTWTSRR